MAKIKAFVPNEEMKVYVNKVIDEEHIESCDVEIIHSSEAVQKARKAIEQGAAVIVARGLQAALIKEYTKVPVVDITLTGQEMGLLVQKARKLTDKKIPKMAFFGYKGMFPDTSYMNEIFQIDLSVYEMSEHDAAEKMVDDAIRNGVDVIVGGEMVLNVASRYNVPTMFLSTTEDSIRVAFSVVRKLLYTSQIEKENHAQFVTVMDTVYNGVLRVDAEKNVTAVNHAAEMFLNSSGKHIVGKALEKIIPSLELNYVDKILNGQRDLLNTSISINHENYMVSIAPIVVDVKIIGAIITINRLQNSYGHQKGNIQDNFYSGYLTDGDFSKIETRNEEMKACIELARMYALSMSPVVIYGETGTEKEIFAQGIHNNSALKNSHYLTVNCSGMNEEQQIVQLFGDETNKGAVAQAALGTLVIRDIDELCLRCQYRLMRVLRYKTFMKTDIEETAASDVRIIVTSRQNLSELVREGRFRMDLYYMLNAFSIRIPPLRERKEDISVLISTYLRQYNRKYAKRVSMTNGGLHLMVNSPWEGNVLQLDRFCERIVLTAPKRNVDEIIVRQLMDEVYPAINQMIQMKEVVKRESPEAVKIRQCLLEQNGSRQKTAEVLGISTATLWRKIKKYGIIE